MAIQFAGGTTLFLFSGGSYVAVANVVSIGGPEVVAADVDTTVLANASAPTNYFKTFIAGWADGGTVPVEMRYDHLQFQTLYNNIRTPNVWRIVFPDNSKWDLNGYLNAVASHVPLEEDIGAPFTIKISGQPTFTP